MDSGNSGSLQSSSGDDGGVATAATITTTAGSIDSMYLNTSTYFNPIPNLQPHHQQQPPSTFFNPTSFSQTITQNSNPMYNLDSLWSRNPNTDPFSNLDHHSNHQDPIFDPNPENPLQNSQNPETTPAKNPKKRTRASRRAPTTVLTTDTTNFRQMVQEFTGIPAAPFATSSSTSSPFSLRRDLLRPSAQKIQLHQNQPSSYLNNNSTTTSNFHLPPSDLQNFSNQPLNLSSLSNLQNLQNQMFPFQGTTQTVVRDATEGENQRSEAQNVGLGSNLKRWRSENENVGNFEGANRNIQNSSGVGSSRSDGDQNQLPAGNEDSWICPSD
uniref:uncharacterized protein LOC122610531 n=1 Tax=Erigeron canadensis TaxID=72917 RepID=UPI001CB92926|nr:uncharacterized protein LOC122610531 [Erigeron canadensis]